MSEFWQCECNFKEKRDIFKDAVVCCGKLDNQLKFKQCPRCKRPMGLNSRDNEPELQNA